MLSCDGSICLRILCMYIHVFICIYTNKCVFSPSLSRAISSYIVIYTYMYLSLSLYVYIYVFVLLYDMFPIKAGDEGIILATCRIVIGPCWISCGIVVLQVLELEVHDAQSLFTLLDDGDGEVQSHNFP